MLLLIRIISISLIIFAFINGEFTWMYVLVNWLSLEFLNSRPEYKNHPNSFYFNLLFLLYGMSLFFVRYYLINVPVNLHVPINRLEHVAFAIVGSFKIYCYLGLKWWRVKNENFRFWFSLILLNILGFLNEIFQASYNAKELSFIFSEDARHDVITNFIATAAIGFLWLIFKTFQRKKEISL